MSEEKEMREATEVETATSKRRHNLKAHEVFEEELRGIADTDDVTVVRNDGKVFVIKGRAVRSHLERGFKIKTKSAGEKAARVLSKAFVAGGAKKTTAKKTTAK